MSQPRNSGKLPLNTKPRATRLWLNRVLQNYLNFWRDFVPTSSLRDRMNQ